METEKPEWLDEDLGEHDDDVAMAALAERLAELKQVATAMQETAVHGCLSLHQLDEPIGPTGEMWCQCGESVGSWGNDHFKHLAHQIVLLGWMTTVTQ